MRKISDITSYTDESGEFTDGDIPSGLKPTPLLAAWFNVIQRELVKVVEGAGLELDKADDEQVWKALVKYFASGEDLDNSIKDLEGSISALGTMAKQNDSAVDINGGTVDGVVIGGESPSSGVFTTLTASQGITGELTGNASTATRLQTARAINGVSFDGSADITVPISGEEAFVTSVRLGAYITHTMRSGVMFETDGYVITGLGIIGEVDGDDPARLRPLQYCINGIWYTAVSV